MKHFGLVLAKILPYLPLYVSNFSSERRSAALKPVYLRTAVHVETFCDMEAANAFFYIFINLRFVMFHPRICYESKKLV